MLKAKIIVNGQDTPIGINTREVRLEIVTQGVAHIESVTYSVYAKEYPKTSVFDACSESCFVYIENGVLEDCTEYRCVAKIHLHDGKLLTACTHFETGLSDENFSAAWIENPILEDYVSEFEQEFEVTEKIDKGRLYIVGLGFYQSELNGTRTDEDFYKKEEN